MKSRKLQGNDKMKNVKKELMRQVTVRIEMRQEEEKGLELEREIKSDVIEMW